MAAVVLWPTAKSGFNKMCYHNCDVLCDNFPLFLLLLMTLVPSLWCTGEALGQPDHYSSL